MKSKNRNYITVINAGNGVAKGTQAVEDSVSEEIDSVKPANAEAVIEANLLDSKKLGKKKINEKSTSPEKE